jgi:hypothetical protein
MTLILSMVNSDQAIVVSDRRLTRGARVVEFDGEEKGGNKGFLLTCDDARMIVTFTGLAEAGPFITRRWLLETLMDVKEPDHRIEGIAVRLAERAKEIEKLRLAPRDRRLSMAMAGYVYDAEPPRGSLIHISNFEQMDAPKPVLLDEAQGFFSIEAVREPRPAPETGEVGSVLALGADRALVDEDWEDIHELVTTRRSVSAITNRAVHAIRSASGRSRTIGRECMSIVLPSTPQEPARGSFHPDGAASVGHHFGSIDLRSNSIGMIVDSPEAWAEEADGTPVLFEERPRKQSRNAPCACGSGKKYKKCCGR